MYGSRVGIKKYVNSRIISITITTAAIVLFAHLVFIGTLCLTRSWYLHNEGDYRLVGFSIRYFIQPRSLWYYYIFDIWSNIFKHITFSVVAFAVAIWLGNKFVAIASPLIAWYLSSYVLSMLKVSDNLIPSSFYDGNCSIESPFVWVVYLTVVSVLIIIVLRHLIFTLIKRRID